MATTFLWRHENEDIYRACKTPFLITIVSPGSTVMVCPVAVSVSSQPKLQTADWERDSIFP
jgi:hypothetical protein